MRQSVDINPLLSFYIWLVDFYEIATPAKLFHAEENLAIMVSKHVQGSLNKFPDFFRMGTFIDSTHMKL